MELHAPRRFPIKFDTYGTDWDCPLKIDTYASFFDAYVSILFSKKPPGRANYIEKYLIMIKIIV